MTVMYEADTYLPTAHGRKPDPSSKSGQVRELLAAGMKPADVAATVGCSRAWVYNVRSRMGGAKWKTAPRRSARTATVAEPIVTAANTPLAELEHVFSAIRAADQERARLRATLEKIQTMIAEALA